MAAGVGSVSAQAIRRAPACDISANGQVTAIAIHPNNRKIIYIGTAWGGVWLTRDGGDHWRPLFDRAPALGVGEPGPTARTGIGGGLRPGRPLAAPSRSFPASAAARR